MSILPQKLCHDFRKINARVRVCLMYPQTLKRATPFILLRRGAETGVFLSEPGILALTGCWSVSPPQ